MTDLLRYRIEPAGGRFRLPDGVLAARNLHRAGTLGALSFAEIKAGAAARRVRHCITARTRDGVQLWRGWFDDRADALRFWQVLRSPEIPLPDRWLPVPFWPSWIEEIPDVIYEFVSTKALLKTDSSPWSVDGTWNNASNTCECIGAGAGCDDMTSGVVSGQGGGAYAYRANLSLGGTASFSVGAGGYAVAGQDGGDSWFNNATMPASGTANKVGAKGGDFGNPGLGGLAADSCGSTVYSGGDGGPVNTPTFSGGGGGGAAGPNGAGSTPTNYNGGAADGGTVSGPTYSGSGAGTNGNSGTEFDATHGSGTGGTGSNLAQPGNGGNYGGGGGGARLTSLRSAGGDGLVWLTWAAALVWVQSRGLDEPRRATEMVAY